LACFSIRFHHFYALVYHTANEENAALKK